MWTLYYDSKTKHQIFDNSNINKIRKLVMDYNYLQSMLVSENLQRLKTRIIQQNISYEMGKLQCIFFESFPISILAVYEVSKSSGANIPGIDKKFFKTLKNKKDEFQQKLLKGSKYKQSGKAFKIKKDLPLGAIVTNKILKRLRFELAQETSEFRFKLLHQCNFKTLQKNYKGSNIRKVCIPKNFLEGFRSLGIPTLRDRVLQQIIVWGIQPISESQADSLSFGFRPQRSATQAIAYVYRKLIKSCIVPNNLRFKIIKVEKEQFNSFSGKKAKFRSFRIYENKKGKRNQIYNYNYWIYPKKVFKPVFFNLYRQYYYLNVDIVKCFKQILHPVIFKKVPVVHKYLYFIKS